MSGRFEGSTRGRVFALIAVCGLAGSAFAYGQPEERDPLETTTGVVEQQPSGDDPVAGSAPISVDLGAQPDDPASPGDPADDLISFSAFTEPVELPVLVNFIAEVLGISVVVAPDLSGSIAFNEGFEVSREELLLLLNWLLEQNGFSLTKGSRNNFYAVVRSSVIPPDLSGDVDGPLTSTKIFRTLNVRPSALQGAISTVLGAGQGAAGRISFIDELGLIIATETPERIRAIGDLIERLEEEESEQVFKVIELQHISATRALERITTILTQTAGGAAASTQQGNQQGGAAAPASGLISLPSRLTAAPGGNALLFRGRPNELEQCIEIIELVDRPSNLENRRYFCGSATSSIAELAAQQGLGEITRFQESTGNQNNAVFINRAQGGNLQIGQQQQTYAGGPVLVVNEEQGFIVAYLTEEQHAVLEALVEEFRPEDEAIVIREYRLEHAEAEETADLLRAVILGEQETGNTSLLPGTQGNRGNQPNRAQAQPGAQTPAGEASITGDRELIEIVADVGNNQLLITAPIRQQTEIERVVRKIDVRRPQVFIDVKIVTVTKNDDFELTVETQLINASGSGGFGQTIFRPLSAPGDGGDITLPRVVNAALTGVTGGVILSDYVPVVINALQSVTDARIVANPVLLVDDNETAEVVSLDQEPTTTTSTGTATTNVTFEGFEDAGTSLLVTPRISAGGGYLSLEYEISLSNFVGSSSIDGVPPPRQERTVRADSVTIPSDRTIVVGGIVVNDTSETILQLPFVGDIPLLGELFKSRTNENTQSIVYVFITPRILSDARFGGHELITEGPRKATGLESDVPEVRPVATRTMTGVEQRVIVVDP